MVIELGRQLFFDKQLSRDGTLACVSCHQPERAFTSDGKVATGIDNRRGTRNAPTLLNRAYGQSFFWDERAPTLEAQVILPIQDKIEMGMESAYEYAADVMACNMMADDVGEGIDAFMQKRKPEWKNK